MLVDESDRGSEVVAVVFNDGARDQAASILRRADLNRQFKRGELIQVRREVRRSRHVILDPQLLQSVQKGLQQLLGFRSRDPGPRKGRQDEGSAGNVSNSHSTPIHQLRQVLMPRAHRLIKNLLRNPLALKRQISPRHRNLHMRLRRQRPHDTIRPATTTTKRPVQISMLIIRPRDHKLTRRGHDFPLQRLVRREAVL